ncbi:RNA polymerase sigma factor [Aquimarina intermedia]|uniref:RNA polymerase sigma-70 factor (ECF subfamily) n=1 Tax=Aquimarina intermedia TaxID=350814 RepID=A0A5S5BTX5_9FLAO|nr:DUF6596 domain-containing protein [Aquimarina intermedia]TYP70414.1 RNA polymerase sigma-70 factor (ECF subfamily) [Aquimarina intermedia]
MDTEIEDAQLRMIFTACHPDLDPRDRIAFALKTVSGFSSKEIASALLTKEETVKKRLSRARKAILHSNLTFDIPQGKALPFRLETVMQVIYLIFKEGFHSNKKEILIREELCGEAMRLCQILLKNKNIRTSEVYALFALFCFHAARLSSKLSVTNELLDLEHQDRSTWHFPLISLGNSIMNKAVDTDEFSCYHYEAAIAAEHLQAKSFEETNWNTILQWYQQFYVIQPMPSHKLTMAVVCLQKNDLAQAKRYLVQLEPHDLEQRSRLYYGILSAYYTAKKNYMKGLYYIDLALDTVNNTLEKEYLQKKKDSLLKEKCLND